MDREGVKEFLEYLQDIFSHYPKMFPEETLDAISVLLANFNIIGLEKNTIAAFIAGVQFTLQFGSERTMEIFSDRPV